MSGFARLLAAASMAAALTCSASASAPALPPGADSPVATFDLVLSDADALAAQRVLLRRRDCSKWWTCGPFKKDKPRLA